MEIKLGSGGGKSGPHSGYSGTGNPGRSSSHKRHDNPHEDEYDEATYEAAKAFASATKSGDSRAVMRTYNVMRKLYDFHHAMDEE